MFSDVTSEAELQNADIVAHGNVVAENQTPGAAGLDDTFQVDGLWKGSNFPSTVTYHLTFCEPAREGVLVLTKTQADQARATGHIEGDMRAYDSWSVLDYEPLPFRLTHDLRIYIPALVLFVLVASLVSGLILLVAYLRRRRPPPGG